MTLARELWELFTFKGLSKMGPGGAAIAIASGLLTIHIPLAAGIALVTGWWERLI